MLVSVPRYNHEKARSIAVFYCCVGTCYGSKNRIIVCINRFRIGKSTIKGLTAVIWLQVLIPVPAAAVSQEKEVLGGSAR